MHILLATGIFPPDIGGPATYSTKLAEELLKLGHCVTVVTYGKLPTLEHEQMKIVFVSKSGSVLSRWRRYARSLHEHGSDADAVIVFSSVSTGIPLMFARLKKPKKLLRLGGEFFWERYTDSGELLSLREWFASTFGFWRIMHSCFSEAILRFFDVIVYSTEFQKNIHARAYKNLPRTEVIGNTKLVLTPNPSPLRRRGEPPFKLLFMGRFVGFKNLPVLIDAVSKLPEVTLTLVGAGSMQEQLERQVAALHLHDRVLFQPPVFGAKKSAVFVEHDLLVLPSVTEISPNVALEAASEGLPVLLTEETGLSATGMIRLRTLRTADQIVEAIRECISRYDFSPIDSETRTYADVARDWMQLITSLPHDGATRGEKCHNSVTF